MNHVIHFRREPTKRFLSLSNSTMVPTPSLHSLTREMSMVPRRGPCTPFSNKSFQTMTKRQTFDGTLTFSSLTIKENRRSVINHPRRRTTIWSPDLRSFSRRRKATRLSSEVVHDGSYESSDPWKKLVHVRGRFLICMRTGMKWDKVALCIIWRFDPLYPRALHLFLGVMG